MKQSGGLLVYKFVDSACLVFLLHPGGPLYAKRDTWSIPKGQLEDGESHIEAAYREFKEEVGVEPPAGDALDLGSAKQKNGKIDYIWALEGDVPITQLPEDLFTMEWPPRSGKMQQFPENDNFAWFELTTARRKVYGSQVVFIDRLADHLKYAHPDPATWHRK